MSTETRVSQSTAIMIERARRKGITEEQLLHAARTGDVSELITINEEWYTYDDFVSYANEHDEPLAQAIAEGYRMTFNTNNGLSIWLQERFDVQEGEHYTKEMGRISGLKLSSADVEVIRSSLALNWTLVEGSAAAGAGTVTLVVRALLEQS
ncbi:hypothetical protein [Paenibacillus alvei]|uniref:hypothetical protein n=1 Tax=Paenibacillus alvei TaxID=44250 RepID=UPI00227F0096|nr:hypothetical protein [Paenibacillus alvei]